MDEKEREKLQDLLFFRIPMLGINLSDIKSALLTNVQTFVSLSNEVS